MKKLGYFPGCSLHGTAVEYDESLLEISKLIGIELVEIDDWNCCGATAAHSMNSTLSVALPSRNIVLAEKQGFDDFLVPCAACYSRLAQAKYDMKFDEKFKSKIPQIIEMDYQGTANPITVLDYLEKYIMPNLSDKIVNLIDAKIACYYGCLMTRPKKLSNIERTEDPLLMEEMLEKFGSKYIDWAFKVECCGAGLSVARTDIVAKLSANIISDAESRSADIIAVACPMCQSNLDMRRPTINEHLGKKSDIPILFITQIIGLSLGISPKKLGLERHLVNTDQVMNFVRTINAVEV